MFAIITPLILRGVIDNTLEDLIDLRLWCVDGAEPIRYRMRGNCLRDIAGCRVEFHRTEENNIQATDREHGILNLLRQSAGDITAGDITLSQRIRNRQSDGLLENALSIEFFIGLRIRVLIETPQVEFTISPPQWQMSPEQENAQLFLNKEALRDHVAWNVANFRGPSLAALTSKFPVCDWDYRLNRAEACMAIYPSVREKYAGRPQGYLDCAYVMDRLDYLGELAAEQEAHMPPDPALTNTECEVLDFMAPGQARAMNIAMHHPLFRRASHMTAAVQRRLMSNLDSQPEESRHASERYVSTYAGIVSHILSTILLTQQDEYDAGVASTRVRMLEMRVADLDTLGAQLPPDVRNELAAEGRQLIEGLDEFFTGISRR